jgi:hypothetical protein
MSRQRKSSLNDDDEEFARILQYQEQALVAASSNARTHSNEQIQRDSELAREMAQNELKGMHHNAKSNQDSVNSSNHQAHKRTQSYDANQHRMVDETDWLWTHSQSNTRTDNETSPSAAVVRSSQRNSMTDMVVYATSHDCALQAKHFDGYSSVTSQLSRSATDCESSDRTLALKIQEFELIDSSVSHGSGPAFGEGDKFDADSSGSGRIVTSSSPSLPVVNFCERNNLRRARHEESGDSKTRTSSALELDTLLPIAACGVTAAIKQSAMISDQRPALACTSVKPSSNTPVSPLAASRNHIGHNVSSAIDPQDQIVVRSAESSPGHAQRLWKTSDILSTDSTGRLLIHSAPDAPRRHIKGVGLPSLDPLFSHDELRQKGDKKKRGGFLRFGKKQQAIGSHSIISAEMLPPSQSERIPSPGSTVKNGFRSTPTSPVDSNRQSMMTSATSPRRRLWKSRSPEKAEQRRASTMVFPAALPLLNLDGPRPGSNKVSLICHTCGKMQGSFIIALERRYHRECFRCAQCHEKIEPAKQFAFSVNDRGDKRPFHRDCFAKIGEINCAICKQNIPRNPDGTLLYVKHPFFKDEFLCPHHAEAPRRRCTGCHRFEPDDEPFIDLNDDERCVCYSCCRSVIVDQADVEPLWANVLGYLEKLELPVWEELKNVPVLVVQSEAIQGILNKGEHPHKGSSQTMARGLCLVNQVWAHDLRLVKVPSLRFEESSGSFSAMDEDSKGFTLVEVRAEQKGSEDCKLDAILCLAGLPRDLTSGILAHQVAHAWIMLHPLYDHRKPIPVQVEEGCAQLLSMLFLSQGLDPPPLSDSTDIDGPSDEELRRYFKFCIEKDDSEVFGVGYRRAEQVYQAIGIEALLSHVVRYRKFPSI